MVCSLHKRLKKYAVTHIFHMILWLHCNTGCIYEVSKGIQYSNVKYNTKNINNTFSVTQFMLIKDFAFIAPSEPQIN